MEKQSGCLLSHISKLLNTWRSSNDVILNTGLLFPCVYDNMVCVSREPTKTIWLSGSEHQRNTFCFGGRSDHRGTCFHCTRLWIQGRILTNVLFLIFEQTRSCCVASFSGLLCCFFEKPHADVLGNFLTGVNVSSTDRVVYLLKQYTYHIYNDSAVFRLCDKSSSDCDIAQSRVFPPAPWNTKIPHVAHQHFVCFLKGKFMLYRGLNFIFELFEDYIHRSYCVAFCIFLTARFTAAMLALEHILISLFNRFAFMPD